MNFKYVLLAPIIFLLFLYFYFPHFMPNSLNKDFEELNNNVYVTPFGIQFNSRAIDLCKQYPRKFLDFQTIAVKNRLESVKSLSEINSNFNSKEIDLFQLNEIDKIEIRKRAEERHENESKREEIMIKYYNDSLIMIKSMDLKLSQNFGHETYCDY